MAEIGCLKDGHFNNLEVEGNIERSSDPGTVLLRSQEPSEIFNVASDPFVATLPFNLLNPGNISGKYEHFSYDYRDFSSVVGVTNVGGGGNTVPIGKDFTFTAQPYLDGSVIKIIDDAFVKGLATEIQGGPGINDFAHIRPSVSTLLGYNKFACVTGKKFWVFARIKEQRPPSAGGQYAWFVGLRENIYPQHNFCSASMVEGEDRVGFSKVDSSDEKIRVQANHNASGTIDKDSELVSASGVVHTLGIYWDGKFLRFFGQTTADAVQGGVTVGLKKLSSDLPTEQVMYPIIAVQDYGGNNAGIQIEAFHAIREL